MTTRIGTVALLVPRYDEAIAFFCSTLGFELVADTDMGGDKRWVLVRPPGGSGPGLLLAEAKGADQEQAIGRQGAGRVFLFLETDDFARDYRAFTGAGVRFLETPRHEAYGTVAVFADPWGNKWDLIEPRPPAGVSV